jgi:hypothetical protein
MEILQHHVSREKLYWLQGALMYPKLFCLLLMTSLGILFFVAIPKDLNIDCVPQNSSL